LHLQDGNIECTTAKIIDSDNGVVGAVKSICKSGGSRLIDYAKDFKARDLAGILRCLTLGIIEVRRDGDDGVAMGERLAYSGGIGLICAYLTFLFRNCSAVSFILTRTIDDSSSADYGV